MAAPGMDASSTAAVFLGPSLSRARASEILGAAYYPPARMGDVYGLIASGVRIIVLIDGIFHGAAAVWHRELLEAMDHGIEVIGASSMGALRAAELHTLGMNGVGTIFEWYRDGVLDGDDEVALLHSDADDGYRMLSQPLVNTRHRLGAAVRRCGLTREQADEAVALVKARPFMWRTHERLLSSELVRRWPEDAQRCLRSVLDEDALDLKACDAVQALELAADLLTHGRGTPRGGPRPAPSRFHRATSLRKRGFRHPDGHLVSGEELWDRARSNRTLVRRCLDRAATRFYLDSLATSWGTRCPDEYLVSFRGRWEARYGITDLEPWLAANGLTQSEQDELLRQHAQVAWMAERGPASFGQDGSAFARLPALWALRRGGNESPPPPQYRARAAQRCLLAAWARARGIDCPKPVVERVEDRFAVAKAGTALGLGPEQWRDLVTELARAEWIVHQQPFRFGHTGWAPITAVLEELQVTGQAADVVAGRM